MATNSWIHARTSKTLGLLPLLAVAGNFLNLAWYRLTRPLDKLVRMVASSSDATWNSSSSLRGKNPFMLVLDAPRIIWKRTLQPMSDFGFGRSVWVGGVGLFVVSGVALTLAWLRGFQLRARFRKYEAVFEFSQACGICVGTPVRIRGVTVGNVVHVGSLNCIEAVAEVEDEKIIIARNSLVEINQSGLLMEPLIDIITPRDPFPTPSKDPLEPDCVKEGLIVCDRERIRGQQGVSLDELVAIFTRVG